MAKKEVNWAGFGLKFLGALVFLYVLYTVWKAWGVSTWWSAANPSTGEVLLSAFWGVAAVMVVGLLLMTLGSVKMPMDKDMMSWAWKAETYSAVSLFSLVAVAHNSGWGWVALVGYVLLTLGSVFDSM